MHRHVSSASTSRRAAAFALPLLVLVLVAGCGGGAQDEPGGPVGDAATLVTPPNGSFVLGNLATIRGRTSAALIPVDVRVNGIVATTTDGFQTFTADIPLFPGPNDVEVSILTVTGEVVGPDLIGILCNVGTMLTSVSDLAIDETSDRLFVLDQTTRGLFARDLVTGTTIPISTPTTGSGPTFDFSAFAVTLDVAADRAFVQNGVSGLHHVDLATGNRTPVTDSFGGLIQSREIEYDPGRDEVLYTVEQPPDTFLLSVDPLTGTLTPVATFLGATAPVGPLSLALDGAGGVLAAAPDPATLLAADAAGVVTILSDAAIGSGPALVAPTGIARDTVTGRIFTVERDLSRVLDVDATTGDRLEISAGVASDATPRLARVAVDGARNRLIVGGLDRVEAVDLASGDRTRLFAPERGSGVGVEYLSLTVDPVRRIAYASANPSLGMPGITAIDLATGDRAPIVSPGFPLQAVAFDVTNDRLLAASHDLGTFESQVLEVDVATGALTQLYAGPGGNFLREIVITPDGSAAYLGYSNRVERIDLTTFTAVIVAGGGVGSGPPYAGNTIALDDATQTLFAALGDTVLGIDLASGVRAVVSSDTVGTGRNFESIQNLRFDSTTQRLILSPSNAFADALPFETFDELLTLDPVTGARAVLRTGLGGELSVFNDCVVTADRTLLAALGRAFDAIIEVPLDGPGATALLSRRIVSSF